MSYLRHGRSGYALWIGVVWLIVGFVTAAQVVVGMAAVGMHHHWGALFFTTAASYVFWAAITPFILALNHRFPLAKVAHWKHLPIHLAAAVVITLAHTVWSSGLEWMFNPLAESPPP